jgi:8-oxo-dGTP pyrophosphatase MutT (NUDIX family)
MSARAGWAEIAAALASRPAGRLAAPRTRRAAVALVLRECEDGLALMFARRAEHPSDPWSGHMAFPGGRAESGDADLVATAVRETLEETGLDLAQQGELLGALDEIGAMRRGAPVNLSIAPFVFRLHGRADLALGAEIVSAHWIPLTTLLARETRGMYQVDDGGRARQSPCLRVEGNVIWGLTYRMFDDLAQRLSSGAAPSRPGRGKR